MKAGDILLRARELVEGDRSRTYGDKVINHKNIADIWNGYGVRLDGRPLTPLNVALMMALLKVARTKLGVHNEDDYSDLAGYGAVAGEIADADAGMTNSILTGVRRDANSMPQD